MTAAYVTVVAPFHPDLARERVAPPANAKRGDRPLVALIGIDRRFGWSPALPRVART